MDPQELRARDLDLVRDCVTGVIRIFDIDGAGIFLQRGLG